MNNEEDGKGAMSDTHQKIEIGLYNVFKIAKIKNFRYGAYRPTRSRPVSINY